MRLTNLTDNHPWNLVLSKEDSQEPEIWEKLKELHLFGEIKPGDRISTDTGDITNNLSRLANMFPGEYRVIESAVADGNFQQGLLRISPSSTANICHEMPASIEQLESQLHEHGHILIRTGQPLHEGKIIELIGGREKLMNYQHGLNERKKVPNSILSDVTPWSKEEEILPHNELSHHIEFPKYVCFICKQPAQYGGETTIYDCQQAFANLSPSLKKAATQKHVIFVRKHVEQRNHKKYDSSWQSILAKNSEEAIAHWTKLGYTCVLHRESENGNMIDVVETQLKRPLAYRYKGKTCLHASIVGAASYWYRQLLGDKKPQMELKWEDGEPFSEAQFQEMEKAIKSARIFYNDWQKNDLLILDNLRIAHGRLPFIGKRLVGILMGGKASFEFKENEWIV